MQDNDNRAAVDNRKSPRITIPTTTPVMDAHSGEPLGELVNLSSDGLMVMSEREIARGVVLQLVMQLQQGEETIALGFGAESLWTEDTNGSGAYWTGMQIIDISPEQQALLDKVVG